MTHATDLKLHVEMLPFINTALYLNEVPFIQYLVVENIGDADSGEVELRLSADIACFKPHGIRRCGRVESLPAFCGTRAIGTTP